ncbi:cation diffusion facilitator family transporter [Desulfoscipio gibsoniae]|uniref:Cation diffusion facilitator family transporter n=1 Tax=Desulfoscipio gibsoniae DSM 7213 TaxID=767817 RepID=R4KNP4_9FIRM|nr:cation diffusion facilitator family transporter [Desulfoscipio gibsoniae]AGL01251.1 cation diffusion facilitator family transporter [Desulfoscipio gibsoniae DSM 7213]
MYAEEKIKVARLSIISNSILTAGKLGVGLSMNSISVISEAIHSGLDLIAALIAFASVRESNKPADDMHRYGHGKFENLAAIIEAVLILVAAGFIINEAITKIHETAQIKSLGLGAVIMGVSALMNLFVSSKLMKVAKKSDSPALAADAWHLRTDVLTSLGVLAGIGLIKLTGWHIVDPLIAILVALLILKAAYDLLRESLGSMLDVRLPDSEEQVIREVLHSYADRFVDYRNLRTRKAGPQRYMDFNLIVPRGKKIITTHTLCDSIERDLHQHLPGVEVIIHVEPCVPEAGDCDICRARIKFQTEDINCSCKVCDKCYDR